jgi:hypothetical protein
MGDLQELDTAIDTAIDGIEALTASLVRLGAARREYRRVCGWARARVTFAEYDRALRALRKAVRLGGA